MPPIVINLKEREMLEEAITHRLGQLKRMVDGEKNQAIKELRDQQYREFVDLGRRVAIFEVKP